MIEVAVTMTSRWLLTLGLTSVIFLTVFIAVLSGLSLVMRAPAELWSVIVIHIQSQWYTLLICTLVASIVHHLSLLVLLSLVFMSEF